MTVCPCSADVGDCRMCGKEYPPKTMSGKPPVSKTYQETINQLAIKSTNAIAGKLEKVAPKIP